MNVTETTATDYRQTYRQGLITNLFNPKVGLFFIAFLPQFVEPSRGQIWLQLLLLGAIFGGCGTLINACCILLVDQIRQHILSNVVLQNWLNKITALIFCLIAIKIILAKHV
jgi:threonine/homoserine/homoserine lactone efflux protein